MRDCGSHDQRWYHFTIYTNQYYTVGGNRLYNFAHRSSQLLHNGPGSGYTHAWCSARKTPRQ